MNPNAATNEALRVADSDGFFSQNLLLWDMSSGTVELNITPLMPQCYQGLYGMYFNHQSRYKTMTTEFNIGGENKLLIGHVPVFEMSKQSKF
jgi:hypothetical protein